MNFSKFSLIQWVLIIGGVLGIVYIATNSSAANQAASGLSTSEIILAVGAVAVFGVFFLL